MFWGQWRADDAWDRTWAGPSVLPQESALGLGTRLTLPQGPRGSRAAALLQGRQTWGPPEMRLLHFVALRVSLAGVL